MRNTLLIVAAVLAVLGVVIWLAVERPRMDPTLPEIGPGAKRVSGSAKITSSAAPRDQGATADASR